MQQPKHNVQILPTAQKELENIAMLHLELVGPKAAQKITNNLYEAIERLSNFPRIGVIPKDKHLRDMGYRYILCEKYLCVYKAIESTIVVYHIVHGASDYPVLFKDGINDNVQKTSTVTSSQKDIQ